MITSKFFLLCTSHKYAKLQAFRCTVDIGPIPSAGFPHISNEETQGYFSMKFRERKNIYICCSIFCLSQI